VALQINIIGIGPSLLYSNVLSVAGKGTSTVSSIFFFVLCCRPTLSVLKQACLVRQPEQRCQMFPARQTLSIGCLYYICHLEGAPTSLWTSIYMPYLAEVCPGLTKQPEKPVISILCSSA